MGDFIRRHSERAMTQCMVEDEDEDEYEDNDEDGNL